MNINENFPIIVYDNQCYLCMKFAKIVDFFARGKITMIGHYSDFGEKVRNEILDESALDMFWFIDKNKAHGGRAALFPLIRSFFSTNPKRKLNSEMEEKCQQGCKTVKTVFIRSYSLLTNSKEIEFS